MGKNLNWGKTQTATQTLKGHNGADSTGRDFMGGYEQALELWQRKNITTDAELAEALNGVSASDKM